MKKVLFLILIASMFSMGFLLDRSPLEAFGYGMTILGIFLFVMGQEFLWSGTFKIESYSYQIPVFTSHHKEEIEVHHHHHNHNYHYSKITHANEVSQELPDGSIRRITVATKWE